jgi:hypothetical protein
MTSNAHRRYHQHCLRVRIERAVTTLIIASAIGGFVWFAIKCPWIGAIDGINLHALPQ